MDRRNFISATLLATAAGAATAVAGDRVLGAVGTEIAQNTAPARIAPPAGPAPARPGAKLRTIALEEHFASPAFSDGPGAAQRRMAPAQLWARLSDLGAIRLAEMDEAGVDMQVLTLTSPGVEQLEGPDGPAIARESNDLLMEAAKKYPTRFAGFASVPTTAPELAVKELQQRMSQKEFKGLVINGHSRGRYLDNKFFWPILEAAEALNAPIYLHPTVPPKAVVDTYYAGFSPQVTHVFNTSGWGWHIETAVHVIRMALGGVFDRYPKLQIIVGHLGEGLPFMQQRMERNLNPNVTKLQRSMAAYLRENVSYTFAGFNFTAPFLDLIMQVGAERIMFSTDFPYASMKEARTFLENIPVSAADRERIAHGNAERMLRL